MRTGAAFLSATVLNLSLALPVQAQAPAPAPQGAPPQQAGAAQPAGEKSFTDGEIEQLLSPIALYPDALFAQVLMASTYPLDIVQADRWAKANPNVKDKALEDALQQQPWDPSVKSLVVFPQVLGMMSEKIDWTQKLGDAFLAQQQDVMAAAQKLRSKAVEQGSLKDSKEQTVTTVQEAGQTVIKIEPTNPQVVYVPTYNPATVYGAWSYPAYPPYPYYPAGYYPGYAAGAAFLGFTAGAIVGGALWGNCNWGGGNVNVNVNRYNNFNRTNLQNSNWQHNAQRRGAVPYRDQRTAQQYGRGRSGDAASRDQYRGRSDAAGGRANAGQGRDAGQRANAGQGRDAGQRANAGQGRDAGQRGNVSNTSFGDRSAGRDAAGTRNASAFDSGRGGAQTRDASSRGSQSLSSARSSGAGSSAAASRSAGGGARASGGGGGGARGGGGGGGRGGGRR